jgi:hypothetical protein
VVLVVDGGGVRRIVHNSDLDAVLQICEFSSVDEVMSRVKAHLRPWVGADDGVAFGVVSLLEGVVGVLMILST